MSRCPRCPKLQPDEEAVAVGEVADELTDRRREPSDHRGYRQDLVVGGLARVLQQVYDLNPVAAGQVLLAGAPQVLDRPQALRRPVGHIQAQVPLLTGVGASVVGASTVVRVQRLTHLTPPLLGVASAHRRVAIADRSAWASATWWPSRISIRSISARSASSSSCTAMRWASRSTTLRRSSRRRRSRSLACRASASRSVACCASRAEPASTPAAPTYTSTSSTPWSVRTNSLT